MKFRAERNCTSGINFISNEMTKDTKRSIKRTTVPQSVIELASIQVTDSTEPEPL